jgi:general secretion pathway protein E
MQQALGTPAREEAFLAHLETEGALDQAAAVRVRAAMRGSAHGLDTVLLELGVITEASLADHFCAFLNWGRAEPQEFPPEPWPGLGLPDDFLRTNGLLVLQADETTATVAVARPLQAEPVAALGYYINRTVIPKVAERTALANHLMRQMTPESAAGTEQGAAQDDDIERLRDAARDVPTIRLLNRLIAAAADRGASDIHIEPLEDQVRVRFRIDGSLQTVELLPKDVQAGLCSRVKILARLNIAEQRMPQDGRIRLPVRGREIDLRVSTAPILHGESIALRILDRQDLPLDLESLGFLEKDADRLKLILAQPNGILLVTGPTGSGKTTTLYAALNLINRPEQKLFTVEDPVEYRLKGINQIQVKPQIGLDFAAVLRSVLRQDPDVIMIGEMRDLETARIAIQASLTGHFVLSTLHTNSAAAAITRLKDMGTESYLLASTVRGVLSQRLVRKLCVSCRNEQPLGEAAARALQADAHMKGFEAKGCPLCNSTGYKGRTVIYELLEVSVSVREAVAAEATEETIHREAVKGGLVPMHLNALEKIRTGVTSVSEVLKVTAGYLG